jgi:DNA invertase Pin-like site-specific DNA recombinase
MKIGYARVSRPDQDLGRQISALESFGCDEIYFDKISGVKTKRPELDKLLSQVKPGDVVIVQKLDRFGRSIQDLLKKVNFLKENKVGFHSINDGFDTTTANGRLLMHILAAIAEFERELVIERTIDSLRECASRGVKLGRPLKDNSDRVDILKGHIQSGLHRLEIERITGWSKNTYYRLLSQIKE